MAQILVLCSKLARIVKVTSLKPNEVNVNVSISIVIIISEMDYYIYNGNFAFYRVNSKPGKLRVVRSPAVDEGHGRGRKAARRALAGMYPMNVI